MLCAGPTNTGMFRSAKIALEKLQNNINHEMMFLTKTGQHTEENDGLICTVWAIVRILASLQQGDD